MHNAAKAVGKFLCQDFRLAFTCCRGNEYLLCFTLCASLVEAVGVTKSARGISVAECVRASQQKAYQATACAVEPRDSGLNGSTLTPVHFDLDEHSIGIAYHYCMMPLKTAG